MKSWKTTCAGITVILAALMPVFKEMSENGFMAVLTMDWKVTLAALATGAGLIMAKDHVETPPPSGATMKAVLVAGLVAFSFSLVGCKSPPDVVAYKAEKSVVVTV